MHANKVSVSFIYDRQLIAMIHNSLFKNERRVPDSGREIPLSLLPFYLMWPVFKCNPRIQKGITGLKEFIDKSHKVPH